MLKIYKLLFLFIIINNSYSQVGINTKNPKASLHVSKPDDILDQSVGIMIPSLTEDDKLKLKLTSEQDGLIIYNNETRKLNIYDFNSKSWKELKDNTDSMITSNPQVYISINEIDKDNILVPKLGNTIYSVPLSMNNYKISQVQCSVYSLGSGSTQTKINVLRRSNGTNNPIATITLNNGNYTNDSETTNSDRILSGDIIFLEIVSVPETAPKGLTCTLGFNL